MIKNQDNKVTDNMVKPEYPEYMVQGIKFIVSPMFHTKGNETIKTVLLRLIKVEVENTI